MIKSFLFIFLISSSAGCFAQGVTLDSLDPLAGQASLRNVPAMPKKPATKAELDEAMKVKDCGYVIKVALDEGKFTYRYGLLSGQTIYAPYSKMEIDNILLQCDFFTDQKLNGKVRQGDSFIHSQQ